MKLLFFIMLLIFALLAGQDRGQSVRTNGQAGGARAKRIALVIGNSDYASNGKLPNARNDALDMGATLGSLGFEVLSGENLRQRQMDEIVDSFGKKLRGAEVGLFYYAGHGMQLDGRNYLIPVDAVLRDRTDLKYNTLDLGIVLSKMEEAESKLNIVVLDACRNNPFRSFVRSPNDGLAPVSNAPIGNQFYISYATAENSVAADSDGTSRNGLFTGALLQELKKPGLELSRVFRNVRAEVRRKSNNRQVPYEYNSVVDDFYFLPGVAASNHVEPERPTAPRVEEKPPSPYRTAAFTTGKLRNGVLEKAQAQCDMFTQDLGGGVTIELARIPAGRFLMGSPSDEISRVNDEGPQHEVSLKGFLMGRYEVTQRQWRTIAGFPKVNIELNPDPSRFKGDDLPVESISWEEAKECVARLNRKLGLTTQNGYRLPSEAEWEYAARAGTETPFAFGPTITPEIVNYDGNYPYAGAAKGVYREKTVPVGSLKIANAWGLFDMHGNVWEWCEDDWHSDYGGAPLDGTALVDRPGRGSARVSRGGGWFSGAVLCRSALRYGDAPGHRGSDLGFRLLRTYR